MWSLFGWRGAKGLLEMVCIVETIHPREVWKICPANQYPLIKTTACGQRRAAGSGTVSPRVPARVSVCRSGRAHVFVYLKVKEGVAQDFHAKSERETQISFWFPPNAVVLTFTQVFPSLHGSNNRSG